MRRIELSLSERKATHEKFSDKLGNRGHIKDDPLLINEILFLAKGGIPWRDMPLRFGKWNTAYVGFRRWDKASTWQQVFDNFANKNVKALFIESATVPAH